MKLVGLVNNAFGSDAFAIEDHWKIDLCAIGFRKGNRLIYVSTTGCKRNHYYYECETLQEDPEMPYIEEDSDDNVSEEQLLEVISKFLKLPRKFKRKSKLS